MRENKELESNSVTAAQFLQERMIGSREVEGRASARGTRENQGTTSIAVTTTPSSNESSGGAHALDERGMSSLERRRAELERGAGGDHGMPYTFTLPPYMPQVLAWARLLVRVQDRALQP